MSEALVIARVRLGDERPYKHSCLSLVFGIDSSLLSRFYEQAEDGFHWVPASEGGHSAGSAVEAGFVVGDNGSGRKDQRQQGSADGLVDEVWEEEEKDEHEETHEQRMCRLKAEFKAERCQM